MWVCSFFFWRWTVDFYLTSQTHCCSMNPHFSPTIHENVVLFFNFFLFFRNESYLPFCALSKLYLMLYRGYFSVLQTVNCSFAFLETYFCTWLILPPLVLHISIDLPFPETDHVNPTRICLEFAGFLFRHSTQLCCN